LLSQSRFVLEIVNQASLYACVPRESSVPTELALGHLRCRVTDMPPQPNSPSGRCLETRLSNHPGGRHDWRRIRHGWVLTRPVKARHKGVAPQVSPVKARTPIIPNQDGAQPESIRKAIGLTIRLVKQRPKWWYFICACATTYTTPRVSPHRARLESNSTGSSFPA
jgi:hypothetical protein